MACCFSKILVSTLEVSASCANVALYTNIRKAFIAMVTKKLSGVCLLVIGTI